VFIKGCLRGEREGASEFGIWFTYLLPVLTAPSGIISKSLKMICV
jgi:hypothetical protein